MKPKQILIIIIAVSVLLLVCAMLPHDTDARLNLTTRPPMLGYPPPVWETAYPVHIGTEQPTATPRPTWTALPTYPELPTDYVPTAPPE